MSGRPWQAVKNAANDSTESVSLWACVRFGYGFHHQRIDGVVAPVTPLDIQIKQRHAIATQGIGTLVLGTWILLYNLSDQGIELIAAVLKAGTGGQRLWRQFYGPRHRCVVRRAAARPRHTVGVGHVGLDSQYRRAIEQVDSRQLQPELARGTANAFQPDHGQPNGVRPHG